MLCRLRYTLAALAVSAVLAFPAARAGAAVAGDVNGDGRVTLPDAQLALRAAVGVAEAVTHASAADIAPVRADGSYGDGQIGLDDATAILRLAVGIDSPTRYAARDAGAGPLAGPAAAPPFDLIPGHVYRYANLTRGGEETITFSAQAQAGGQDYTAVSLVPDGARDVLIRLDPDGNLWQRTGDAESIRLKLGARVGDTWTFDFGPQAQARLVSRDAALKTPDGLYTGLLQFDFFVGPDFGWTEWVGPQGFWVGFTRDTIAGPVDFRLTGRDVLQTDPTSVSPVLSDLWEDGRD